MRKANRMGGRSWSRGLVVWGSRADFPPCTSPWWGVNSEVGGMPGLAMPSEVKVKAEEPPRALREVDRLTRKPEKLANAGGRCWKDTSERMKSPRLTGLLTLPGEDWSPPGKKTKKPI